MDVSVVVPLYNKAAWVQRALDSISRQTHAPLEVLVVDDGSTDGSDRIARAHALAHPGFRVLRQPNAGPGAARNAGAAQARGEVLAFLDADDEWAPDYLADAVSALQAWPEVASVTLGHRVVPGDEKRQRLWRRRRIPYGLFRATPETDVRRFLHVLAYMSPCATVIRREPFLRHGGFHARGRCTYGEDAALFLRLLLCEPVGLLAEQRVTFHLDASDLSHNHARARPVEPFLSEPEEITAATPRAMRSLLRRFLSIRASKTACMLAFWGRHEEARALLDRFERDRTLDQPWALAALLAVGRMGQLAGALARAVPSVRSRAARSYARTLPELVTPLPIDPHAIAAQEEAKPRMETEVQASAAELLADLPALELDLPAPADALAFGIAPPDETLPEAEGAAPARGPDSATA